MDWLSPERRGLNQFRGVSHGSESWEMRVWVCVECWGRGRWWWWWGGVQNFWCLCSGVCKNQSGTVNTGYWVRGVRPLFFPWVWKGKGRLETGWSLLNLLGLYMKILSICQFSTTLSYLSSAQWIFWPLIFLTSALADGPKDTSPEDALEITYVPSLKLLEEEVMEKMGIKEPRRHRRSYWYWADWKCAFQQSALHYINKR